MEQSGTCNPNQGEEAATAAFIGVREAQAQQLRNIIVEGDSQKTTPRTA